MRHRKTIRFLAVLAILALMSAAPRIQSLARGQVDILRTCTLWADLDIESFEEDNWEELKTAEVQIDLYLTADMDEYGRYQVKEEFQCPELENINEGMTDWQEAAEAAARLAELRGAPDQTFTVTSAGGSVNLPVGMYLLCPHTVSAGDHEYVFLPCLASLPGNDYETSGDDRWRYTVETELKPERRSLMGDLLIQKRLESYNESLGTALFVFQVEAVKDLDGDGEEETVYSDVLSVCFDKPGEKSILAENIPAGAKVTVTEIYTGASYETVTEAGQTAVILPRDSESAPACVEFVNRYNRGLIPGSGVVNHFSYDDFAENWELKETVYSRDVVQKGNNE